MLQGIFSCSAENASTSRPVRAKSVNKSTHSSTSGPPVEKCFQVGAVSCRTHFVVEMPKAKHGSLSDVPRREPTKVPSIQAATEFELERLKNDTAGRFQKLGDRLLKTF